PCTKAELEAQRLVFSIRHSLDIGNMDDPLGAGPQPHCKFRRTGRPARREWFSGLVPEVETVRWTEHHEIGAVRADARRHLGKGTIDFSIDVLRPHIDETH